jgi:hypothetical protein
MKDIDKSRQRRDKAKAEKDLISTYRRYMRLMRAKRSMRLVELEKPVRSGYKRYFVLREDVAKSREANIYRGLLKYLQNTQYSRDKKFQYKDYKTKKMLPMQHFTKPIDHKTWNKIVTDGLLTTRQQGMFQQMWKQTNPKNPKVGYWQWVFQKEWVFAQKVEPHYKTHSLLLDPQLESEITKVSNKIERNNLWPKIDKILGRSSYGGWNRHYKIMLIEKHFATEARNILEYEPE